MEELTDAQRETLLAQMKVLLTELEAQLVTTEEHASPVTLDQSAVGRLSRMDAIQQQSMAQAQAARLQQRVTQLRVTIDQFDDDYGYCRDCGEPIAFARLRVRPETPFCIPCQQQRERR